MDSLTHVTVAINTLKDLVPIEIAKSILSAASTILLAIKVDPWSIVRNRPLSSPFPQDTMKNKEDFGDLIDQCDQIGKLVSRTVWKICEKQTSPMLDEALEDLARRVPFDSLCLTFLSLNAVSSAVNRVRDQVTKRTNKDFFSCSLQLRSIKNV